MSSDRCQAARTPRLIRQSDPEPERYRVDLLVRGQMAVEQAGREAALEPGDFTVVDWSRPARWATASERAVSLMFPRALLALPHREVARLGGVRISGRHGAGARCSPLSPARSSPTWTTTAWPTAPGWARPWSTCSPRPWPPG